MSLGNLFHSEVALGPNIASDCLVLGQSCARRTLPLLSLLVNSERPISARVMFMEPCKQRGLLTAVRSIVNT